MTDDELRLTIVAVQRLERMRFDPKPRRGRLDRRRLALALIDTPVVRPVAMTDYELATTIRAVKLLDRRERWLLSQVTPRDRDIVAMHDSGMTYRAIGGHFGISHQRAQQLAMRGRHFMELHDMKPDPVDACPRCDRRRPPAPAKLKGPQPLRFKHDPDREPSSFRRLLELPPAAAAAERRRRWGA